MKLYTVESASLYRWKPYQQKKWSIVGNGTSGRFPETSTTLSEETKVEQFGSQTKPALKTLLLS